MDSIPKCEVSAWRSKCKEKEDLLFSHPFKICHVEPKEQMNAFTGAYFL